MRKWLPLMMLASAQFVMVLDTSVMNVAISQIVEDLDTSIQGVQTAITLYTLVMAAFMLLGAKLGDILGRNRAFAIGLAIYGVGSLTTALSPDLAVLLIGWSGIEGFGAVLVIPAIAALTAASYEGRDRALAYALLGGVAAVAVAAGPLIGGWVTTEFTWRYVFAAETVVVDRDPAPARADPAGPGAGAAAAARPRRRRALVDRAGPDRLRDPAQQRLGLRPAAHAADDRRHRDHATRVLADAVPGPGRPRAARGVRRSGRSAAPASATTSCSTRRCCGSPQLRAGLSTLLGQQLVLMGTFFVIPVYLQVVLGLDAFETGKRLLPLSVAMLVFALLGPRLAARRSPRTVAQVGLVAVSIGAIVMLATLDVELNDTGFKTALGADRRRRRPARIAARQRDHVLRRRPRRRAREAGSRAPRRTSGPRSAPRSSARCCSRRWRPASASGSPRTPTCRRRRARRSSPTPTEGIDIVPVADVEQAAVDGGLDRRAGERRRLGLRRRPARGAAAGARRGRARRAALALVHAAAADAVACRGRARGGRLAEQDQRAGSECEQHPAAGEARAREPAEGPEPTLGDGRVDAAPALGAVDDQQQPVEREGDPEGDVRPLGEPIVELGYDPPDPIPTARAVSPVRHQASWVRSPASRVRRVASAGSASGATGAQVHSGPNSGGRETIGFRTSASRARSAIPRAVRPKCSMQASPVPETPNSSPIPTAKIGHRVLLGGDLADGVGEAADDAVLLGGDGDAGLRRATRGSAAEAIGLMIETLTTSASTPSSRSSDSAASSARQTMWPVAIRRDVLALAEDVDAVAERLGDLVVDDRRRRAGRSAGTSARRWLVGVDHRAVGLVVVGRDDDLHLRHRPHQRDVLDHLVRGAVLAERDAAVRGADPDLELVVGDPEPDLVVGAAGGEDREGRGSTGPCRWRRARRPSTSCSPRRRRR